MSIITAFIQLVIELYNQYTKFREYVKNGIL